MSRLELKIPPPVVGIAAAAAMWCVAQLTPSVTFAFGASKAIAIALTAAGIAVDVSGLLAFRAVRTTVNPLHPERSAALVIYGAYRYSRNPMYLGLLLILSGWAAALSNLAALALLPAFIAYINRFQIAPEERALRAKFGEQYANYANAVRRWV